MKKLLTLLLAALTIITVKAQDKKDIIKTGWNFGPLPVVGFDSDLGFQYGLCCDIFNYGDGTNYPQYDYVVINDGSTDDTRKICARRGFNLLDLPVNLGLSGAIKSGMRYANYYGYDYVLQLDGDGQHDPKYISLMQEEMDHTGCDIVIGSRFKNRKKEASA